MLFFCSFNLMSKTSVPRWFTVNWSFILVWSRCSSLNLKDSLSCAPQAALQKGTSKSESDHLIGPFLFWNRTIWWFCRCVGVAAWQLSGLGYEQHPHPSPRPLPAFIFSSCPSLLSLCPNDPWIGFVCGSGLTSSGINISLVHRLHFIIYLSDTYLQLDGHVKSVVSSCQMNQPPANVIWLF